MLVHDRQPSAAGAAERRAATDACDLCGAAVHRTFDVKGYRFFECAACDYAFLPRATRLALRTDQLFDDHYFTGGGAGYHDYIEERTLLREHGLRYAALLNELGATGRVLDAGAAAGFVLRGLTDGGFEGIGLEPNAGMARFGRDNLGLDIRADILEAFESDERFAVVTMIQVVDHFFDINAALASAARLTVPGGHWLIEFGNRASITAHILGRHWHEYAPPTVLRAFSLRSLHIVAERFGFDLISHGHPVKRIQAGHAKSLLSYMSATSTVSKIASRLLTVVPDRMSMRYPGDDITWAVFRRRSDTTP